MGACSNPLGGPTPHIPIPLAQPHLDTSPGGAHYMSPSPTDMALHGDILGGGTPFMSPQPVTSPPYPVCSHSRLLTYESRTVVSTVLFSTGVWLSAVLLFRQALKLLLSYHGWMFEPHGKMSRRTRIWVVSDACSQHQLWHRHWPGRCQWCRVGCCRRGCRRTLRHGMQSVCLCMRACVCACAAVGAGTLAGAAKLLMVGTS